MHCTTPMCLLPLARQDKLCIEETDLFRHGACDRLRTMQNNHPPPVPSVPYGSRAVAALALAPASASAPALVMANVHPHASTCTTYFAGTSLASRSPRYLFIAASKVHRVRYQSPLSAVPPMIVACSFLPTVPRVVVVVVVVVVILFPKKIV